MKITARIKTTAELKGKYSWSRNSLTITMIKLPLLLMMITMKMMMLTMTITTMIVMDLNDSISVSGRDAVCPARTGLPAVHQGHHQ